MTYVAPGMHLLIDFWDCACPEEVDVIEKAMRESAEACGATVLEIKLHHFGEGAGITGVAILAESHISIHTWPETGYAAIDIFMCGKCDPKGALPALERCFRPGRKRVEAHQRGKA